MVALSLAMSHLPIVHYMVHILVLDSAVSRLKVGLPVSPAFLCLEQCD